jgi:hypothetical protein
MAFFSKLLKIFKKKPVAVSKTFLTQEDMDRFARSGLFAAHHVIPLEFEDHPVVQLLSEHGRCDLYGVENQLMLPIAQELATKMRVSRYSAKPVPSYIEAARQLLDDRWASAASTAAQQGDMQALAQLAEDFRAVGLTMKAALIEGELFVAG